MKNLLFVFALLFITVSLQAQEVYQWFGAEPTHTLPPTGDWRQGYAWMTELGPRPLYYGDTPTANSKVKINNVLWGTNWEQWSPVIGGIYGPLDVAVGDIFICEAPGLSPESLTVGIGGSLLVQGAGGTAAGQINLGYQGGTSATLFIDGGTATVNGPVHVGWGGTGTLKVRNGSMMVDNLDFAASGGAGWLWMKGNSQIVIRHNYFGVFPYDLWPIVLPGSDEITVTYDEVTGWTTLSTPEPASIALLGLGLAFLKKRK